MHLGQEVGAGACVCLYAQAPSFALDPVPCAPALSEPPVERVVRSTSILKLGIMAEHLHSSSPHPRASQGSRRNAPPRLRESCEPCSAAKVRRLGLRWLEAWLLTCPSRPADEARGVRAVDVFVRSDAEQLAHLVALVDRGELHVDVDRRVSLPELATIHAEATAGTLRGKVVVLPQ